MKISADNLLDRLRSNNPKADLDLVRMAFDYAQEAHAGQLRKSGDPYILHPLRTAEYLAGLRLPVPIVIAGLLHDVPEDTSVSLDQIRKDFGPDIAGMVEGVTKLSNIKYRGIIRYVENLRKMFVAMASDVRVILIKFADRKHNLETLDSLLPIKRQRIALESLEIYAPIASRLGMNEIKGQIEDLCFQHVLPQEYERVSALAKEAVSVRHSYVQRAQRAVEHDLRRAGIPVVGIEGRVKHLYSLYRKLQKRDQDISQIHDLIALRVIMADVAGCYAALGIIHNRWKPMQGRIKDYIAVPKTNGYRSLHTTVEGTHGETVEFQIRTREMHEQAERGIAAHWQYDEDGKRASAAVRTQLAWVRELADGLPAGRPNHEGNFLESLAALNVDVLQNRIFVFTPEGDVIDLPEGSTPVDFAYVIHSEIGDGCGGAKINDEMVSLDSRLQTGDVCEILVDRNRPGPNPDWIDFVKTSNARSHIRSHTRAKIASWAADEPSLPATPMELSRSGKKKVGRYSLPIIKVD
ncbi:MAG: RelA/SpoT family protein [Patescibacteria group bacterium]|nr:RelA/SpoT family protein [Patescibacteria group bacterium]